MLLRVEEVSKVLKISKPSAYKIMQTLNKSLKEQGFMTIAGRCESRYLAEKFNINHDEIEKYYSL